MPVRCIQAPGVEIREIDKSGYTTVPTGTAVYLKGFTDKGEAYRPMEITTRAAYEQIYGAPDNEAERYTYAAACETLNQGGRLWMARLPYDNDAFEKMPGIKYKLGTSITPISSVSYLSSILSTVDPTLEDAIEINCVGTPVLYDLSSVQMYRADELKVPANTFLVVDVTGGTYGKVQEDNRKGKARELIGIVPVVTTAVNGLYAQSYLGVELSDIWHYEPIAGDKLSTLNLGGEYMNNGLMSADAVVPYNTYGTFFPISAEQKLSCNIIGYVGDGLTSIAEAYDVFQMSCINEWQEDLSTSVEPNIIAGSISAKQDDIILMDVDGEEVPEAPDLVVLNDIRNAAQALVDFYKVPISYSIVTVQNVADALVAVAHHLEPLSDEAVNADQLNGFFNTVEPKVNTDIQSGGLHAPIEITEDTKISDLVDWVNKLWPINATGKAFAINFKYQVEVAPYYATTTVPQTMSLDACSFFPPIQPTNLPDKVGLDPEHLKDIGVVVFKMYLDPAEGNKVSYEIVEAYAGSLYKDAKDPNTGVTKFIDTIINSQSKYINFFSNCFSSTAQKESYNDELDILVAPPTTTATLGFYSAMTKKDISISRSILDGMNKCFDKVEDINKLDIDIVPDAGLANIASYLKAIFGDKGPYDLRITDDLGNSMLGMWKCEKATDDCVKMWKTIEMKHDNFCKNIRKDCMFIADGLRPLVLQGQKKTVRDTVPTSSIDKDILPYVPAICGINTSYGAGYIDWFEMADDYTGDFFWCPPSIKAMGCYINTDLNFEYWDAPAGLTRGIIAATDVAFSPNARQAGNIYQKNWNYAINYPNDGIILEGQKTFQTKPTALDRVNVRRTMLRLERQVYKTVRYFVYENNTAYTRQRVVDALEPILKACWKSGNGGIARYKIVCDDKINDANTIDNNELKVQIGIIPNKSAEYILVDFVLGNQSSTWEELLG